MAGLDLLEEVKATLEQGESPRTVLPEVLDLVLRRFDCTTGTVHLFDQESGLLILEAQRGIPEIVLDKIKRIPIGKGMAGIAAERREPVQVCNLQTDNSGVVRQGARDTRMEGSIAAPVLDSRGQLKGTLGVAKPVAYDFTAQECDLLMQTGALLAERL
jgi:putative methionine-R-sulfoxide reductase with GAF domain